MFSKPKFNEENMKMHVLTAAMMPLPRSVAGSRDSRNQNFKRSGIKYEEPDKSQNQLRPKYSGNNSRSSQNKLFGLLFNC